MMQELSNVIELLQEVIGDVTVSKNIRLTCDSCIQILNDNGSEVSVKCDRAIQALNITDDPNINMYTKTLIWQVISLLETQI
jgi:uncharacterized protein (UPF0147 family)